jgi:hypothetical protein
MTSYAAASPCAGLFSGVTHSSKFTSDCFRPNPVADEPYNLTVEPETHNLNKGKDIKIRDFLL